jgi:hypothetical protein
MAHVLYGSVYQGNILRISNEGTEAKVLRPTRGEARPDSWGRTASRELHRSDL